MLSRSSGILSFCKAKVFEMNIHHPMSSLSLEITKCKGEGFVTAYFSDKSENDTTSGQQSLKSKIEDEPYKVPNIRIPSKILPDEANSAVEKNLQMSKASGRKDEKRIFYGLASIPSPQTAVISMGKEPEDAYEKKDAMRTAVSSI
jgi:hypothetical protein